MNSLQKRTLYLLFNLYSFAIIGCSILQVLSSDINATTQKAAPHCVWYGECNTKMSFIKQNCPYDGPPKPLDIEGQRWLSKWCPELVVDNGDGVKTCCDTAQAKTFDSSIYLITSILESRPCCLRNFLKYACALACSPEQSRFINIANIDTNANDTKYISEIDYYISNDYISGVFNSCQHLPVPATGQEALDLVCGQWGSAECTPTRLFQFMGDSRENPYVPCQVNFINSSKPVDEFIPMNASVELCYPSKNDFNKTSSTEHLIRYELNRYEQLQEQIENEKLNVTVLFTQTRFDEDSDFLQFDSVGFQPLMGKQSIGKSDVFEPLDENSIELIFKFAHRFNFTAVVSQEKFAPDGSIINKFIYDDDLTILYKNGTSNMIYKDREAASDDEENVASFLKLLKDYEIPATIHKAVYDNQGSTLILESREQMPQKVRIMESKNLKIDKQMKVSEALKRTIVMKEDPTERMKLLCKYLAIQYPNTKWEAVIGGGNHYIQNFGYVKLLLEGEIYTVFTTTSDDAESEDDD